MDQENLLKNKDISNELLNILNDTEKISDIIKRNKSKAKDKEGKKKKNEYLCGLM